MACLLKMIYTFDANSHTGSSRPKCMPCGCRQRKSLAYAPKNQMRQLTCCVRVKRESTQSDASLTGITGWNDDHFFIMCPCPSRIMSHECFALIFLQDERRRIRSTNTLQFQWLRWVLFSFSCKHLAFDFQPCDARASLCFRRRHSAPDCKTVIA